MKTLNPKYLVAAFALTLLISCNEKNNSGNTTPEGTQLEDQRPHQNNSMSGGIEDTITSPGSNATDIERGTDPNMQNQSGTHGNNTQSGDNGTGSGTATPAQ